MTLDATLETDASEAEDTLETSFDIVSEEVDKDVMGDLGDEGRDAEVDEEEEDA